MPQACRWEYTVIEPIYLNPRFFKSLLTSLLEQGRYLQCRYEGNILILSGDAKAVFDESGNMLELYDLKQDAQENLAGRKEAAELEFEMILLLSKFNME